MSLSSRIEHLENFKMAAEKLGCVELELCLGCGKHGCASCHSGTGLAVRNLEALKLNNILRSMGITEPEKHPAYKE